MCGSIMHRELKESWSLTYVQGGPCTCGWSIMVMVLKNMLLNLVVGPPVEASRLKPYGLQ